MFRDATGGKAAKAWSLAGFWELEKGGCRSAPVKWPPLWLPCLPKIYRGGSEYYSWTDSNRNQLLWGKFQLLNNSLNDFFTLPLACYGCHWQQKAEKVSIQEEALSSNLGMGVPTVHCTTLLHSGFFCLIYFCCTVNQKFLGLAENYTEEFIQQNCMYR